MKKECDLTDIVECPLSGRIVEKCKTERCHPKIIETAFVDSV